MTLLPLVYFFPATRGALILCPDEGVIYNVPIRVVVAQIIAGGNFPLWNPYIFNGMPLFASAQAGVLFPLNWFYLAFNPAQATNLMMLSTYMLAALGAYLYARRSGSSIAGAALTSLVWQGSGFLIGQIGHMNIVHTAGVLPWLFWTIDGYAARGRRWSAFLLAALVAVQTFAGHQQTLVYALVLAAAYAIVMSRSDAERAVRRRYLYSVVFLVTGVLLAAVQILPTLELTRNSVRASATYDFFSSFSLPPRMLTLFFAPYLMGGGDGGVFSAPYTGQAFYNEYIGYAGLMTLSLAALAIALKRDRRTIFWTVAVVVSLLLAMGRFLPFDVYKLVHYIPVLNLFRVPARHLMEVDFALAVLAGRALTFLPEVRNRAKAAILSLIAGLSVAVLTFLAVTLFRPADFRLGRQAPVSFLRAPELFVPVVIALVSAWALWHYARLCERRYARSVGLVLIVLIFDLGLWGQTSGWRLSPTPAHPIWRQPRTVETLRALESADGVQPSRIITEVQPFFINLGRDEEEKFRLGDFMMSLQPDTYMMHRIENAAGYDGFGLKRYSELAGDMKVWGELPDPARSLRGPGREFDILNVHYLVRQSPQGEARRREAEKSPLAPRRQETPATISLGGVQFAQDDLGAPSLTSGERLVFSTPSTEANRVALVTSLSWSGELKDGEVVGHVRLRSEQGEKFEFELRAGDHSSEWAYDRPDLRGKIAHRRAPVATTFKVEDPAGNYDGHTYVAVFQLPQTVRLRGGEIDVATNKAAPKLVLDVKRVSLLKDEVAQPLRGNSVEKLSATEAATYSDKAGAAPSEMAGGRWQLASEDEYVMIYRNTRALPRAWVAGETIALSDELTLQTIRTGQLPDGRVWDPRTTALVDPQVEIKLGTAEESGEVKITRRERNRMELAVSAKAASVLVLSENHYPGWRASLDGASVETLRVNYNLRGIPLTPGEHQVVFVYRPWSVLLGLLISLLTAALLLAWCWLDRSTLWSAAARRRFGPPSRQTS